MKLTGKVVVSLLVFFCAFQETGVLIDELHAIEIQHELVGLNDACYDLRVVTHLFNFMELQRLRFPIHAIFSDGESTARRQRSVWEPNRVPHSH